MNYIIWNGKDSRTINGLIISELPPVTKPEMEVSKIKIDGFDGDIIEELGYKSYTKKIKIGLYGNYDIDEIIKYFTGVGNIVFSNEPNKYYKTRIINNVDYNRLLRYKTAIIEFYTQPYKYLLNEENVLVDIDDIQEVNIENKGLEDSKPVIKLFGLGNISIYINELLAFNINIEDEYVTVDSSIEEAYKNSELKNNFMIGEFPLLKPGNNKITWVGNLTKLEVKPNSRWL